MTEVPKFAEAKQANFSLLVEKIGQILAGIDPDLVPSGGALNQASFRSKDFLIADDQKSGVWIQEKIKLTGGKPKAKTLTIQQWEGHPLFYRVPVWAIEIKPDLNQTVIDALTGLLSGTVDVSDPLFDRYKFAVVDKQKEE